MKAEIVRWGDLAKRDPVDLEGLRVLLDGGLVTIRSLGPAMASLKNRDSHRLSYDTPWGMIQNTTVRAMEFTAVMVLGSGTNEQEADHASP